jgi:hypothetical protein
MLERKSRAEGSRSEGWLSALLPVIIVVAAAVLLCQMSKGPDCQQPRNWDSRYCRSIRDRSIELTADAADYEDYLQWQSEQP